VRSFIRDLADPAKQRAKPRRNVEIRSEVHRGSGEANVEFRETKNCIIDVMWTIMSRGLEMHILHIRHRMLPMEPDIIHSKQTRGIERTKNNIIIKQYR
jgi:hypothetical protein